MGLFNNLLAKITEKIDILVCKCFLSGYKMLTLNILHRFL